MTLRELEHLMIFNSEVTAVLQHSFQDLTGSALENLGNIILFRHDAGLDHLEPGLTYGTVSQLRSAPLLLPILWMKIWYQGPN